MFKSFDVVVIGAGIIGLSVARQFLLHSDLSVAVVDASLPCSGTTGAGQGCIWMGHRTPGSEIWDLAKRSSELWRTLVGEIVDRGLDPLDELGWKTTGGLLVGRNLEESAALRERVERLLEAGVRAEYLSDSELQIREPDLGLGCEGCAAFIPNDAQLDARRAVAFIENENRGFASKGRYDEFYNEPAVGLKRSRVTGKIEGVKTKNNTLYGKKAVVVAAGCWSGSLMQELSVDSGVQVNVPVQPRKGILLVAENNFLKLNHAAMEIGYTHHLKLGADERDHDHLSISMAVTIDADGNLLLGSSREFAGLDTEINAGVAARIWERSGEFYPALKQVAFEDLRGKWKARVGLRPYMPDGKPVIGAVPQMSNLYLATGHEGGGITMALGTAEMIVDMVLDNPVKVDPSPFAPRGRFVQ